MANRPGTSNQPVMSLHRDALRRAVSRNGVKKGLVRAGRGITRATAILLWLNGMIKPKFSDSGYAFVLTEKGRCWLGD